MTIAVDVTPDEEAHLQAQANEKGLTVVAYLRSLAGFNAAPMSGDDNDDNQGQPPLNDYWAGFVGLVDSEGRFNFSHNTGKAYAQILLKNRQVRQTDDEENSR